MKIEWLTWREFFRFHREDEDRFMWVCFYISWAILVASTVVAATVTHGRLAFWTALACAIILPAVRAVSLALNRTLRRINDGR